MADKQIDFPPLQKQDSRVAPFMLELSLRRASSSCAIILATDVVEGSWLGPW